MKYHIDCPFCHASLVNTDQAALQAQFSGHMQVHGWTAAQANAYFPLNCWERPAVPAVPVP